MVQDEQPRSRLVSLSRRAALAGLGLLACSRRVSAPPAEAAAAPASSPAPDPAPRAEPRPADHKFEVLEVGPGKRFASLTLAGAFMNSKERWSNGDIGPARLAKMGFHVVISPGPQGYYVNDSGSHSRRWKELVGWPPYEGNLYGPVVIEGEPGKPAPVLETDGNGDGVIYYQKGLFATGNFDATFRHLAFRGFRRADGHGNLAAIRLGDSLVEAPINATVLMEDCEFSGCDNGIMGGAGGQKLTLSRCYFHNNGNDDGRTHNIYVGEVDELYVDRVLSSDCNTGHLLKTRAKATIVRNSRLLGGQGSESACLDAPNAGVLDMDGVVCQKSANSEAVWLIHYSGENQDAGAGHTFHELSSVSIRNVTLIAPPRLARHPSWRPIRGFANQSGDGPDASGKGSRLVRPQASNVRAFGLEPQAVGLPSTMLTAAPALDWSSPVGRNV